MPRDERHTQTIPYGTLGIVPLASCSELGKKGKIIILLTGENSATTKMNLHSLSADIKRDSYIVSASTPLFWFGEGRVF